MVENIRLKIIESHEEILDIINRPVGTLVNMDWHSGYPLYAEKTLDVDSYSSIVLKQYPEWIYNSWATVLASKGYISQYLWFYPHDCTKDEIKVLNSKNGDCIAYNIRFNRKTKIPYKCITICMDFFGCKTPIHWNPNDRKELFVDVLNCLTARNLMLIISKSKRCTNYDVEKFIEEIDELMINRTSVEVI